MVSVFFVPTDFVKRKFVENGLPASKIVVKPNFILDPGPQPTGRSGFLFVGRLTAEKGINTILDAMKHLGEDIRLSIIGDGPLRPMVEAAARNDGRITYLGRLPQKEVLSAMGAAKCVIVASLCYETFGRVAAEAFACRTPVITSSIGALAEVVEDGRTGLHFPPGDAERLARAIDCIDRNPNKVAEMQEAARCEYESKYTPERNYQLLLQAYAQAGATVQ
jgi:glycosyltransferase involved in cell wall biosynthesis